jgi:hypothetical protein
MVSYNLKIQPSSCLPPLMTTPPMMNRDRWPREQQEAVLSWIQEVLVSVAPGDTGTTHHKEIHPTTWFLPIDLASVMADKHLQTNFIKR